MSTVCIININDCERNSLKTNFPSHRGGNICVSVLLLESLGNFIHLLPSWMCLMDWCAAIGWYSGGSEFYDVKALRGWNTTETKCTVFIYIYKLNINMVPHVSRLRVQLVCNPVQQTQQDLLTWERTLLKCIRRFCMFCQWNHQQAHEIEAKKEDARNYGIALLLYPAVVLLWGLKQKKL